RERVQRRAPLLEGEGMPSLRIQVIETNTASGAQARARFLDAAQETRIGFEPILEPIVFRIEADQDARRLAVARDDDVLLSGLAQETREIVLDLGQRDFSHAGF